MESTRSELQDQALSKIKFIYRILKELDSSQDKKDPDLTQIFESSLKFSLQEFSQILILLNQVSPNTVTQEGVEFFSSSGAFNNDLLQSKLQSLQKYLLASLL